MALETYTPPSDRIIHETEVDFVTRDNYGRTVYLVQTTDNKLPIIAVSLYQNGVPYVIPANAEGNVRWKKPDPDRHYVYNPLLGVNAARNVAYIEVTDQMVVTAGRPKAIIELTIGANTVSSERIPIIIDQNPMNQIDLESTDEMKTIQEYVNDAERSATAADTSAKAAASSASAAKASETAAKNSQTAAATSATNAKASETAAKNSQTAAANSATAAATSTTNAATSASEAKKSQDAAKYYYEQSKNISQGLEGGLLPMGTVAFAQLNSKTKEAGYMYNISDAFTTTAAFKEGAGHAYPPGTNVYYTADGYWDCLAGYQVTSVNGQTGAVTVTAVEKTGDTMTGDLTFSGATRAIKYASGSRTGTPIAFYQGDLNGSGVVIGDGGRTIVGSGESAQNLRNALGTQAVREGDEQLHLSSDQTVYVHTKCQDIANRKTFTFGEDGKLTAPGGFVGDVAGKSTTAGIAEKTAVERRSTTINYIPGANQFEVAEFSNESSNIPDANAFFHVYTASGPDTRYGTQIAVGMSGTGGLYYRRLSDGSWTGWEKVYSTEIKPTPVDVGILIEDGSLSVSAGTNYAYLAQKTGYHLISAVPTQFTGATDIQTSIVQTGTTYIIFFQDVSTGGMTIPMRLTWIKI